MSSRSIGVTKVELRRWMMSWVIRSPSCSALRISRARPLVLGPGVASSASSSRAARRVFCPASVKRSKKVRSRGSEREARHGGQPTEVAGDARRAAQPAAAASCSAARAAWRSRSSSWTLRGSSPFGRRAASRRRRLPSSQALVLSAKQRSSTSSSSARSACVLDRRDQLDPVVEVARHQVGGADAASGSRPARSKE